jgi:hypothetical protein
MIMVRRMIATITQIESVVTPSGNSGHVVVPKAWIGKDALSSPPLPLSSTGSST